MIYKYQSREGKMRVKIGVSCHINQSESHSFHRETFFHQWTGVKNKRILFTRVLGMHAGGWIPSAIFPPFPKASMFFLSSFLSFLFFFFPHLFNPTNRLTKYNYSTIQIEATNSQKKRRKTSLHTMWMESKELHASHMERIERFVFFCR